MVRMNKVSIRVTKILGLTSLAAILALVIMIEALYYKGLAALPDAPYLKSNSYPQFLQDSEWVMQGGEGEIKMYKVSPITFVSRLIYSTYASSSGRQVKVMGESGGIVREVARSLLKNQEKSKNARTPTRQLSYASVAIWVSNHWNARDSL
jgi:hypothetical protein